MNRFLRRAAILAMAMLLISGPALARTAAAEETDPPSAASELPPAADGEGAAPEAASSQIPPSPATRHGLDILQAVGMFILVITLLFITLKIIGRFSRFRTGKGRGSIFNMRGVMPLDNRKYLAAVEVDGRLMVLGVTPERVTPLAHWAAGSGAGEADDFAFHLREDGELPDISVSEARGEAIK